LIGDRLILEGHIPEGVVADLLTTPAGTFDRMLVYQDKMNGATDYVAWGFRGEPRTYAIDAPIGQYLAYLAERGEMLPPATAIVEEERALLPLVLVTGLLDGLNPCAFAVLLFFIAFLFTIRRSAASIWGMGLIYVGAIYLAYFLIGLGLMRAVLFVNDHHFTGSSEPRCRQRQWEGFWWDCAPSPAREASMWPSSACLRRRPRSCRGWGTWGSITWPSSCRCWSSWQE